jgi:hypothetical protein
MVKVVVDGWMSSAKVAILSITPMLVDDNKIYIYIYLITNKIKINNNKSSINIIFL